MKNMLVCMTYRQQIPSNISRLRGRMAEVGIRRQDIAAQLGYGESLFSLYINSRRPAPEGFEERVQAALDLLEQADRAAKEARDKVLAQGLQLENDHQGNAAEEHPKEPVVV